ncbi:MAG: repair protein RecN [Bacteroidota bacterium]|jgi:DNA repair protein RecN (Recombination protein N)
MLQRLFVQNYAIITRLEISFDEGMVVITGETGAGKSIIMGALSLTLGERADSSMVKDKSIKTIIEAVFTVPSTNKVIQLLKDAEIDIDEEVIVRREIQSNGKSRAFVNDTPVSLAQLQQFSSQLVDLHQQFDTLELGNQEFQRLLVDAKAGIVKEVSVYGKAYQSLQQTQKKIASIRASMLKADQEKEYKLFLLKELQELNWQSGEEKVLEDELTVLSHAEQIKAGLARVSFGMSEGEQPLLSAVKSLITQLQAVSKFHNQLPELLNRFDATYVELKDIAAELDTILDGVVVDDERLDQVNQRLALAQRLVKKHGLVSPDQLVDVQAELSNEMQLLTNAEGDLEQLEKELVTFQSNASELANGLSVRRKKVIPGLEKSANELLSRVGMPNAKLKIELLQTSLHPFGIDQVSFLFDANKSGKFEPIHKVASGGELSRLMLVLKSLVAGSLEMPTLIFDEIDSGISGEAAKQVGVLMGELSTAHQLITITHQPQIAAMANQHLFIYKQEVEGGISTNVKSLSKEERISTIAQMMAGVNPSDAVLESAREMMKR